MVLNKVKTKVGTGYWKWEEELNILKFVKVEDVPIKDLNLPEVVTKEGKDPISKTTVNYKHFNITFLDTISANDRQRYIDQVHRKRFYKVTNVVMLQDIKDVVLFLVKQTLPNSFLSFFATPQVNIWLRGAIVYMQYYLQTLEDLVWSKKCWKLSLQPGESPQSVELSRNLTNLRAILGFQYCQLITTRRTTSSDKCLFELLIRMSPRVVWIALGRRYLYIIEAEMNRLFRSEAFSRSKPLVHHSNEVYQQYMRYGIQNILHNTSTNQKVTSNRMKWLDTFKNSPMYTDYMMADYKQALTETKDQIYNPKLAFFSNHFFASEEELEHLSLYIGILGKSRKLFDCMLYPKSASTLQTSTMHRWTTNTKQVGMKRKQKQTYVNTTIPSLQSEVS